jgi:hypothetical protein
VDPAKKPISVRLQLDFETEMSYWHYSEEDAMIIEEDYQGTYSGISRGGIMRYIIAAVPVNGGDVVKNEFTQKISDSYNGAFNIELLPGSYDLMVWADFQIPDSTYHYNATNFKEITFQGEYAACTDTRDAFRGKGDLTLEIESAPVDYTILMERPLAKYEFKAIDLNKFPTARKIKINYSGFLPDTYDMSIDKPSDSAVNMYYESTLPESVDGEVSLCYDYVFINGKQSDVTVQMKLYDGENNAVGLSDVMNVPLKRSQHTIVTGRFFTATNAGNITFDPEFDGDHILELN